MYKVNEKTYSYDSIVNQEIKRKFVNGNVYCCVTSMVEYILSTGDIPMSDRFGIPFTYDDIENLYDEDEEPQDIYEWWLVDDWFANKLAEHDEPVIRNGNTCGSLWGRTCTGQAILLDGVIGEICEEMGILEGQEHSWEGALR